MLELNYIRNNLETVKQKVEAKNVHFDSNEFIKLDKKRRELITLSEQLKSQKKKLAKQIGQLRRTDQDSRDLEKESVTLSGKIEVFEKELAGLDTQFQEWLLNIPNLFDDSVPVGPDQSHNKVVREWGKKPEFTFTPKPHWELGEINQFLDLPRAAKIAGSRFALYFDTLAKLERILLHFMLEVHTGENGYTEVLTPFLANEASLIGTGNLPKFKEDLFKVEGANLYLIPTAEVPLTNIHREEILSEQDLPIKYAAYTPCFRSEAGSHGKDIRGLVRHHQFNKIELMKFTSPDQSYQELEALTQNAESILQRLGLHYRVVVLCSGDLSFSSAKTYDLEVWMPARNDYMEISSCSNFEEFQARRAKIKYKRSDGKSAFVHTLNGSGLALGRTVAAIMENYQLESGKIRIPEILSHYFNGRKYL